MKILKLNKYCAYPLTSALLTMATAWSLGLAAPVPAPADGGGGGASGILAIARSSHGISPEQGIRWADCTPGWGAGK
jgi:hypothetical protein